MTIKFKRHKRYDVELADAGVWFKVEDENENQYGSFRCRFLDPTRERTKLTYKRIRAKYAAQIKSKALSDEDAIRVIFVEAVLSDWKDVLDENGKQVPFSIDNAMAYFSEEENLYVLGRLGEFSGDARNYAVDPDPVEGEEPRNPVEDTEATAKN